MSLSFDEHPVDANPSRLADEWYRVLFDEAAEGIFVTDTHGRYIDVNQRGCEMLGYTHEELLNLSIPDVLFPEDIAAVPVPLEELRAGRLIRHERRLRRKDGRAILAEISAHIVGDGKLVAFTRDITERKRAQEALVRSEQRFHALVNVSAQIVWTTDAEGRIIEDSPSWRAFTEQTHEQLHNNGWLEAIHPDDRERVLQTWEHLLATRQPEIVECRLWHRSGVWRWVVGRIAPLYNADDSIREWVGMIVDITERKQQEELLKNQAYVLEHISEGINYVDSQGIIRYTNATFDTMFGYEHGELIGQHVAILNDLPAEENERLVIEIMTALQLAGVWSGELHNRKKDGTAFFTRARINELPLQGEVHWVTLQEDITEHKRGEEARVKLEEQLRQAQKMESIGRLAGGVAHDFNNLLTVILGHADFMNEFVSPNDPLIEDLEQIKLAGERASMLTRQLLAFSRKQILSPSPIDLNNLMSNLQKMLRRLIGEDIRLSVSLQPGLWSIRADAGQIEQVIMNLVVNARDAMPTGGTLRIETANVRLNELEDFHDPDTPRGACVLLTVSDTGAGMDPHTQAQIFEPFFTTKAVGKGTGMGLSMVYGIVKQSGGNVIVDSLLEHGTTFRVYLPATEPAGERPIAAQLWPIHQGRETILLVEDEAMVRDLVCATLEQSGYVVLTAEGAETAFEIVAGYPEPIDLLLTDVIMPIMSGREIAEQLTEQRADLKVLFMSGYTDDIVVRHGLLTAEVEFLSKPFSPRLLLAKVRDVLDTLSVDRSRTPDTE